MAPSLCCVRRFVTSSLPCICCICWCIASDPCSMRGPRLRRLSSYIEGERDQKLEIFVAGQAYGRGRHPTKECLCARLGQPQSLWQQATSAPTGSAPSQMVREMTRERETTGECEAVRERMVRERERQGNFNSGEVACGSVKRLITVNIHYPRQKARVVLYEQWYSLRPELI